MVRANRARIAVVGTGWWSTRVHLPALAANPDCELVAVVDRAADRAEEVARHFGIGQYFVDHLALRTLRLDGVVVATPPDTHYAIARDCLAMDADVLVEKPLTVAPRDGWELVELAAGRGRNLHVGYPYPYSPLAKSLKELVDTGRLGAIRLVTGVFATAVGELYKGRSHVDANDALFPPDPSTYSDPMRGGGQAQSQLTHLASLFLFVTSLEPTVVQSFTLDDPPGVDSWDAMAFRCRGGAVGTLAAAGSVARGACNAESLELFGDSGHARWDLGAGTLTIRLYGTESIDRKASSEAERYPREAPVGRLVDTVLGRKPVLVGGVLGAVTTDFISAALRSNEAGHAVAIEARRS